MGKGLANVAVCISNPGLRGSLKMNEVMSKHTSWKVGGAADRFYVPSDPEDLTVFLSSLPEDEPVTWIGLGSNVLVRDAGIRGTVISLNGMKERLEPLSGARVLTGSGVACAKVARFSARAGLTGGEFLAGIPGTVGGALAMNAGAFGSEIWRIVEQVETVTRRGERIERGAADYTVGYRHVDLPGDEWFVSAVIRFEKDIDGRAQDRIRELLAQRSASQPTGQFSCGSVFRNPENDFAARLIQACGLKGFTVGNAYVSEKHANFIINNGKASAEDIEALILHVQKTVADHFGIELRPEVRILGEAGAISKP